MTATLPPTSDVPTADAPKSAAPFRRRRMLSDLAAALVLPFAPAFIPSFARAASTPADAPERPGGDPLAGGATLLVAGPDGGALDRWARTLTPALASALPPGAVLRKALTGAADGVTGANQFDARTPPDGTTLLIAPGAAALAWLSGDPRVHFDVAHWVPVCAGVSPGIVAGRVSLATLRAGTGVRIGAAGPAGADMAGMLALELLGLEPVPVFGLETPDAVLDAFHQQTIDAVFLHGEQVQAQMKAAAALGAAPLFSFGTLDETGARVRDPQLPDLPHMVEFCAKLRGGMPSGPLYAAWRAAAAAAQTEFAVILPQLSPAALVARWRQAAAQSTGTPDIQSAGAADGLQIVAGPLAAANTAVIAVDANVLLDLRAWLKKRFNWRPT